MTQQSSYMSSAQPPTEAELKVIAQILHHESGIVIAAGKGSMVQSRLAKRLRALGLSQYQPISTSCNRRRAQMSAVR